MREHGKADFTDRAVQTEYKLNTGTAASSVVPCFAEHCAKSTPMGINSHWQETPPSEGSMAGQRAQGRVNSQRQHTKPQSTTVLDFRIQQFGGNGHPHCYLWALHVDPRHRLLLLLRAVSDEDATGSGRVPAGLLLLCSERGLASRGGGAWIGFQGTGLQKAGSG